MLLGSIGMGKWMSISSVESSRKTLSDVVRGLDLYTRLSVEVYLYNVR